MKTTLTSLLFLLGLSVSSLAQETAAGPGQETPTAEGTSAGVPGPLDQALSDINGRLEASRVALKALRDSVDSERLPLSKQLNDLEGELTELRTTLLDRSREVDNASQGLDNLRNDITATQKQSEYISGLLRDYAREFESRLHIAEMERFEGKIKDARLAAENKQLTGLELHAIQAAILSDSLDRLHEVVGGGRFAGSALDEGGVVHSGTFALIGPLAIFRSDDGTVSGTVEQKIGSLQPTAIPFLSEEDRAMAQKVLESGEGSLPIDPTLGDANKIAETENETILEEIENGGFVMKPIVVMAGLALLIALYKWLTLSFVRRPSRRSVARLIEAVGRRDAETARREAAEMRGPEGRMLHAGALHLGEPRELIEEVMYESVLTTKLKIQKMLPFIAICAASAPLLGLLGTVSGIINTFKMIKVFGSGDVKSLSSGISEALITTKYGLLVAIPSLLLHAFLSRKAKGIVSRMESSAVAFVNQVSRAYRAPSPASAPAEVHHHPIPRAAVISEGPTATPVGTIRRDVPVSRPAPRVEGDWTNEAHA